MNRDYDYSVLASPQEAVQCSQVMAQSFVVDAEEELQYLNQVGFDHARVLRQGSNLVGGLALLPMGQWFGGRRVTMTGVASVAIAPHIRGQGAATYLMTAVVQELASQGVALSTLYPAVQSLYQKVGYGLGGSRYTWQVATDHIQLGKPPLSWCQPQALKKVAPEWIVLQHNRGKFHYQGILDRHPLLWQRLLQSPGEGSSFAYTLGHVDNPEGYFIAYQRRETGGAMMTIRDWAAPSQAAMQSIWGLVHQQRSQVDAVQWAGGAVDPLALALPEQRARVTNVSHWMVRILNLKQALEQRGYPPGMHGELHLEVSDPLVAQNHGRFRLEISQGQGRLTPGGRGEVALTIQDLASLFTGMRSAQELRVLGNLEAPSAVLPLATALFSGPRPWMPDFF
jgi:predicted acetyltransferase